MSDLAALCGAIIVPPAITAEALAVQLAELMNDGDRYLAPRHGAVVYAEWTSWRRVVREMDAALASIP